MAAINRTAISLVAAAALSGCVAAVIPVAAGSVAAHRLATSKGKSSQPAPSVTSPAPASAVAAVAPEPSPGHSKRRRPRQPDAGALPGPGAIAAADAADPSAKAVTPEPLPQDPSRRRPGQLYSGALPGPGVTGAADADTASGKAATPEPLPQDPSRRRPGQLYSGALPGPGVTGAADADNASVKAMTPEPLPQDPSRRRPGQLYSGVLPGPGAAVATNADDRPGTADALAATARPGGSPPTDGPLAHASGTGARSPASATSAPAVAQGATGWAEVVRYVAANMAPSADRSALLARGSAAADPHWVPCGDKPAAVLAPSSLAMGGGAAGADAGGAGVAPAAKTWIDALGTLGIKLVLVARNGAGDTAAVKAAFARAGLPALVDGDTLRVGSDADMPAIRASVGARYCVVAVAGRDAADFPSGWLPATTPAALAGMWGAGWFLFTP